MLGYLQANRPGKLEPTAEGWYDTGDIVELDDLGFVSIVGRAKRFAKVAGEMISLSAVEAYVSALWSEYQHAVVAVADERKGERLVLVSDNPEANRETLLAHTLSKGIPELMGT